jgi:hypothetical protein
MKWEMLILDSLDRNEAVLMDENRNIVSVIKFDSDSIGFVNMLKFLSLLPRNRISITNSWVLREKGAPIELTRYGKISMTSTVRKLMGKGYSPKEIAESTGFNQTSVDELYSRIHKKYISESPIRKDTNNVAQRPFLN